MAERTYTIEINGQDIQIPAWASEATLANAAIDIQNMAKVDKMMLETLKEYSQRASAIIKHVDSTQQSSTVQSIVSEATTKQTAKRTKQLTQRFVDAASFLGSTEAPLTSLIGVAKEGGPVIAKGVMKFVGPLLSGGKDVAGKLGKMGQFLDRNSEVLSDALFAWLGWNAGKLEAFSKVQQQMIDNGAVMFESAAAYRNLRRSVNMSGVTYDAFAKTITANNAAVTQFGGNTSLGSRRFRDFFKRLDRVSDNMGDFGLSNNDLLQQTGEFLEFQRLTGGLLRVTADQEARLTESFTALQIETAALASITGLTRSQALQALTSVDDPNYSSGLQQLEGAQKEAATAMMQNFNLIQSVAGPDGPLGVLSAATGLALANFKATGGQAQIRMQMAGAQDELAALQRQFGEDIIDRLELAINTGDTAAVDAIFYEIINAEGKRFTTAQGVATDNMQKVNNDLVNTMIDLKRTFNHITPEKMADARTKAQQGLIEAGSSTYLINQASKAFLALQNGITLPMDYLASGLETAASGINSAIDYLTGTDEDRARYDEEAARLAEQRRIERATQAEQNNDMSSYNGVVDTSRFGNVNRMNPAAQAMANGYSMAINKPESRAFGGLVERGNPYFVNDKLGKDYREMFVPEENGRILSNREIRDMFNNDLTNSSNNSTLKDNLVKEYQEIVAAKRRTYETLKNLHNFTKSKMMDDRINRAIDQA